LPVKLLKLADATMQRLGYPAILGRLSLAPSS
jgi:hypothetical protein